MEAVGFWPRGNEPCGRRRSGVRYAQRGGFYSLLPTSRRFLSCSVEPYDPLSAISVYCTVTRTDALLLAKFGSVVSAVAVPLSVITTPAGAVTFTVNRTVHIVFGAMLLFS